MNGDQFPDAIYLILWLVLVGAALVGRKLPIGKMWKMALIWLAIFGLGFLIFDLVMRP
jgi:aspartyl protease family protein